MNNKGFTLVELLAVLIILTVIMGVAIPSISSSLERTKAKQKKAKEDMLLSYAEEYVTDHKNAVYNSQFNPCHITLDMLSDYLPEGGMKDADNNDIKGYIKFTRPDPKNNPPLTLKYEFIRDGIANNTQLCG